MCFVRRSTFPISANVNQDLRGDLCVCFGTHQIAAVAAIWQNVAVTILKNLVLLLALLLSWGVGGCEKETKHKNVCPIDGQAPEWSRPIDAQTCEYFHFSPIERKTHSWTGPCEQTESP
jgi:hypothetical protein